MKGFTDIPKACACRTISGVVNGIQSASVGSTPRSMAVGEIIAADIDFAAYAIFSPVVPPGKSWIRMPPCHGDVVFPVPNTVSLSSKALGKPSQSE